MICGTLTDIYGLGSQVQILLVVVNFQQENPTLTFLVGSYVEQRSVIPGSHPCARSDAKGVKDLEGNLWLAGGSGPMQGNDGNRENSISINEIQE